MYNDDILNIGIEVSILTWAITFGRSYAYGMLLAAQLISGIITCISAVVSAIGSLFYKKGIKIPRGHLEHSFDGTTCKMTLGMIVVVKQLILE